MIKEQLYILIGETWKEAKLSTPSGITLEYKSNLFNTLDKIVPSTSYTFKLPACIENQVIFDFANDVRRKAVQIRRKYAAKYLLNGIDILPNAKLYVTQYSGSTYDCVFTWGVHDGFNKMLSDDMSIQELPDPSIKEIPKFSFEPYDPTQNGIASSLQFGMMPTMFKNTEIMYGEYNAGLPYSAGYYADASAFGISTSLREMLPMRYYGMATPPPLVPVYYLLKQIEKQYGIDFNLGKPYESSIIMKDEDFCKKYIEDGGKLLNAGCIPLTGKKTVPYRKTSIRWNNLLEVFGVQFGAESERYLRPDTEKPTFYVLDVIEDGMIGKEGTALKLVKTKAIVKVSEDRDFGAIYTYPVLKDIQCLQLTEPGGTYEVTGEPKVEITTIGDEWNEENETKWNAMGDSFTVSLGYLECDGGDYTNAEWADAGVSLTFERYKIEDLDPARRLKQHYYVANLNKSNKGNGSTITNTVTGAKLLFYVDEETARKLQEVSKRCYAFGADIELQMAGTDNTLPSRMRVMENLPDISCMEFVKSLYAMLGGYPHMDNQGNIHLARYSTLAENIREGKVIDWSQRLISNITDKNLKYKSDSFAKKNYYLTGGDEEDDSKTEKNELQYFDGSMCIDVSNDTLQEKQTALKVPFYAKFINDTTAIPAIGNKYGGEPVMSMWRTELSTYEAAYIHKSITAKAYNRVKHQDTVGVLSKYNPEHFSDGSLGGLTNLKAAFLYEKRGASFNEAPPTIVFPHVAEINTDPSMKNLYHPESDNCIRLFGDKLDLSAIKFRNYLTMEGWEGFKDDECNNNSYKILQCILADFKEIEVDIALTVQDIYKLDISQPVYIERYNSYFAIEKVQYKVNEQYAKCTLIRIPNNVIELL